jgi:hypothetical protein
MITYPFSCTDEHTSSVIESKSTHVLHKVWITRDSLQINLESFFLQPQLYLHLLHFCRTCPLLPWPPPTGHPPCRTMAHRQSHYPLPPPEHLLQLELVTTPIPNPKLVMLLPPPMLIRHWDPPLSSSSTFVFRSVTEILCLPRHNHTNQFSL